MSTETKDVSERSIRIEHTKQSCECGHDPPWHVDRVTFPSGADHHIACRYCEAEETFFPPEYLGSKQVDQSVRDFYIQEFSLPPDTSMEDARVAARDAYLKLPAWLKQKFDHKHAALLKSLKS